MDLSDKNPEELKHIVQQKEQEIDSLEESIDDLERKIHRVEENYLFAKNGVRYLRNRLREYEDEPTAKAVKAVGEYVEKHKEDIPGLDR